MPEASPCSSASPPVGRVNRRSLAGDIRRLACGLEEAKETTRQAEPVAAAGEECPSESTLLEGSCAGLLDDSRLLRRLDAGLGPRPDDCLALPAGQPAGMDRQIQAFEQRSRLSVEALEEAQRRQVVKLRRAEHAIEEVVRRLSLVEEELRVRPGPEQQEPWQQLHGGLEARISCLEQQQGHVDAEVRALQEQVDERLNSSGTACAAEEAGYQAVEAEEAARAAERGLAELERRASGQIQELAQSLASLRVKVDGQLHRVGTLADRLQTAHEPAVEALRSELAQVRAQEQHRVDAELAVIREGLQAASEGSDETLAEVQEALRQAQMQMASALHPLDSRLAEAEAEISSVVLQTSRLTSQLLELANEADVREATVRLVRQQLPWGPEPAPALGDLPPLQARGAEGAEAGCLQEDSALSPADEEAAELRQELDAVAEQLYAADRLAERVESLQQRLAERSAAEQQLAAGWGEEASFGQQQQQPQQQQPQQEDSAAGSPTSPAHGRLQGLAQDVGSLQAELLAWQLSLQMGGPGAAGQPLRDGEIEALAARIVEAERELEEGPSWEGPAAEEQPVEGSAEPLAAVLTSKLDPLEEVLRVLAQHLFALQQDLRGDAGGTCDLAELQGAYAGGAALQVQIHDLYHRVATVEDRVQTATDGRGGRSGELRGATTPWAGARDLEALQQEAEATREVVVCLSDKVKAAEQRLDAAEQSCESMGNDLQQLWHRHFGEEASPSHDGASPCSEGPAQLDELRERVARLQLDPEGCQGRRVLL